MAAVFLNIEKAFNTTWHSGLLYKLSELQFFARVIKLIPSFLDNGKFKSVGRRRNDYTHRNTGRSTSRLRPCPSIVQSIYKRCLRGICNSSCLFADDIGVLVFETEKQERRVLCKLQLSLTDVISWCQRCDIGKHWRSVSLDNLESLTTYYN
jgi:hypothetical protein